MSERDEKMARLLAGDVTPEEVALLLREAEADPSFRARLVEQIELNGLLGVALEDEFTRERRHQGILRAIEESESKDFVSAVQSRVKHRRWWTRGVAVAAAALVVMGLGTWAFFSQRPVATVVRTETVTWPAGSKPEETSFHAGERLKIEAGLVELQIGKRGKMIVEGPADLEFASAERSILRRGRVVMRVTPAGHGYRMETPEGAVVDLGTEFGVSVGADGKTETHVLEGEVEAFPNGGGKVLLKRDDALRFADKERIPADGGAFYTALPPHRGDGSNYVHWSLDEGGGTVANAVERGLPEGSKDFQLRAFRGGAAPQWMEGKFGRGLAFDGKGSYAESNFRGIGGGQPRTVCFWVKVPQDFSQKEGFAILSWGRFQPTHPGEVWQIAINPIPGEGPIGRVRVGTHAGQVVGTTDLRDGQWHHVAVVLYGGSRPNIGTHVMVYLDGKLEQISRRALREIDTEIETAKHGVWLGRNITYDVYVPNHQHGGFFRGAVDEPYIFDAALSQDDVLELMRRNQPPR